MKGITIHHSASHDVPALEIDRWHRERGWNGIGYHFVIRKDGSIEMGRPWDRQGAHHYGYNATNFGICVTGNFNQEEPSREQIAAIVSIIRGLKSRFGVTSVVRHHENCPGKNFPFLAVKAKGGF